MQTTLNKIANECHNGKMRPSIRAQASNGSTPKAGNKSGNRAMQGVGGPYLQKQAGTWPPSNVHADRRISA